MTEERRYDIIQEVGRGAMGIVYKAMDRETSECIALKVLKPEVLGDLMTMDRFKNEMRVARKITHKNVCRIFEFTRIREGPAISMEFVDGETLRSLLNRLIVLNARTALTIARQVAGGLREAHAQGVVHRDLKPENLMMDKAGHIKVMDFGVARVFVDGSGTLSGFVGTPAYMAPEQVEGREVDQRADIYAFGLILYEMLTGRPVFTGDAPLTIAYKHVNEHVTPPRSLDASIPPDVEVLILRCLEKEPERRFQSMGEIETALAGLGVRLTEPTGDPIPPIKRGTNTTFIMARRRARVLMLVVQGGYFCLYLSTLIFMTAPAAGRAIEELGIPVNAGIAAVAALAMMGLVTRVYLVSGLMWQHPDLPRKFRQMFPALWLLDSVWAASPMLLIKNLNIPTGVIFGAIALLAYLPFSQKTLMEHLGSDNPGPKL